MKMLLITAAVLATAVPLVAHHGAATFDTEKELTLKGTVTEWIWANPHCFLKFDAKDDTGTVRNWVVETQNPTTMSSRGWRRVSFKAGDPVTVALQPVKNGAPVGKDCQSLAGEWRDTHCHRTTTRCGPTAAAGEVIHGGRLSIQFHRGRSPDVVG